MAKSPVFKDFIEYWYFVRTLSENQREKIFNSLDQSEQKKIHSSFERGAWKDLFFRDKINNIVDDMEEEYKYNIIELRAKVLSGKSVYIPTEFWDSLTFKTKNFDKKDLDFILSGIQAEICKENPKVTLLLKKTNKK